MASIMMNRIGYLNLPWPMIFFVGNILFVKRESHLVIFLSGEWTQVDYILYGRHFQKNITHVKAIPGEEVAQQYILLTLTGKRNL